MWGGVAVLYRNILMTVYDYSLTVIFFFVKIHIIDDFVQQGVCDVKNLSTKFPSADQIQSSWRS